MFAKFHNRIGHYVLLISLSLFMFFVNLGGPTLWDVDEGRNSACAYEMMVSGDWVVPRFNGDLRIDKPVLLYWLQIFAYQNFGVNEFSARVPSAVAALLMVLLVYELGRSLFTLSTGLLSGVIVATCPMVIASAHFANQDALLNLFSVLGLFLFWREFSRTGKYAFLGCAAAFGLGVLAKGPVGLLLPSAVIALFLLWNRKPFILLRLRLISSVLLFCAIALPWYVLVCVETNGDFVWGFLGKHNVNRFLSPMESHSGGPHYYLLILLAGFAPWSIFLGITLWYGGSVFRPALRWIGGKLPTIRMGVGTGGGNTEAGTSQNNYRFMWCWIAVYLLFFTIAATKLPNYILPMITPLAILTARALDQWRLGLIQPPIWLMRTSLMFLALIGVLTGAGLLAAGGAFSGFVNLRTTIDGLSMWATIGVLPIIGAAAAWWHLSRQNRNAMLVSMATSAVLFLGPLTSFVVPMLNSCKAPSPLVQQSGAFDLSREIRIVCLDQQHLASLHFYCGRHIHHVHGEKQVLDFFGNQIPVFLFVTEQSWEQIRSKLRTPHRIVAGHTDLYRSRRVLVVTNR